MSHAMFEHDISCFIGDQTAVDNTVPGVEDDVTFDVDDPAADDDDDMVLMASRELFCWWLSADELFCSGDDDDDSAPAVDTFINFSWLLYNGSCCRCCWVTLLTFDLWFRFSPFAAWG